MDTVVTNEREWQAVFEGVKHDLTHMRFRPVLERGLRMFAEEHAVAFAAQREPEQGGNPWAPLAPSTIKRKGHNTILVETGRLRGSLASERHADGIREMYDEWPGNRAGFIFGTEVPYSIYHMQGRENMPARPHVGVGASTVDLLTEHVADHVVAELVP